MEHTALLGRILSIFNLYDMIITLSTLSSRKEGDKMNVTYADLFQFCMFIVALIGLCYQIFKDNKKK